MAYSAQARAMRRCTGTRKDGEPCRAWACWDDPLQRCNDARRPTAARVWIARSLSHRGLTARQRWLSAVSLCRL